MANILCQCFSIYIMSFLFGMGLCVPSEYERRELGSIPETGYLMKLTDANDSYLALGIIEAGKWKVDSNGNVTSIDLSEANTFLVIIKWQPLPLEKGWTTNPCNWTVSISLTGPLNRSISLQQMISTASQLSNENWMTFPVIDFYLVVFPVGAFIMSSFILKPSTVTSFPTARVVLQGCSTLVEAQGHWIDSGTGVRFFGAAATTIKSKIQNNSLLWEVFDLVTAQQQPGTRHFISRGIFCLIPTVEGYTVFSVKLEPTV